MNMFQKKILKTKKKGVHELGKHLKIHEIIMKKIYMYFIVLILLVSCAKQDKIILNKELTDNIFTVAERSFYTDNTIINNDIITFHNPLDSFHHPSFTQRSFAPTVLKRFEIGNHESNIVDNDVTSLCNRGDIEKCSSFREYLSYGLIRSENKLFFLTDLIIDKISSNTVLAMSDLDGSNLEVIYTFPNKETIVYGYVYLNEKLYYSTSEEGLMYFDLETKKNNIILLNNADSSVFHSLGIESIGSDDILKFTAVKYTDESERVHQNAFIMLIDDELKFIREHDSSNKMISNYRDYSIIYDDLTNEIKMVYDDGEEITLENDYVNGRLGQGDIFGNDYLVLNYYSTKNSDNGGKIVLYQVNDKEITKINEILHNENLFLNFMYKDLVVFGRLWSDDQFGDMIHPSYVQIDSNGLGKLNHIDENK